MTAKTIGRNQFYLWDRDKHTLEVIDAGLISVEFVNKRPQYKFKEGDRNVMIVQALNEKRAAAKFLTKLKQEQDGRKATE